MSIPAIGVDVLIEVWFHIVWWPTCRYVKEQEEMLYFRGMWRKNGDWHHVLAFYHLSFHLWLPWFFAPEKVRSVFLNPLSKGLLSFTTYYTGVVSVHCSNYETFYPEFKCPGTYCIRIFFYDIRLRKWACSVLKRNRGRHIETKKNRREGRSAAWQMSLNQLPPQNTIALTTTGMERENQRRKDGRRRVTE